MKQFRTPIPPVLSLLKLSHSHSALCIGSCFAEHIGGRLEQLKFPTLVNPFGIVFNPISVSQSLELLLSDSKFKEEDLFENLCLWHSYAHHGRFSNPNKMAALDNINLALVDARNFLKKTTRLIVTLGTANVFVLRKTGKVVANCHKVPSREFERRRLRVDEVAETLHTVFQKLKLALPELEIIATVSPVRHLRDGLMENQRSKATLLLGLDEIQKRLSYVHYFPSYEILLDDLRDYRFYEEDMTHPNKLAVDYIWEYFQNAYMDEKTKELNKRIDQLLVSIRHRPFHPQSKEHKSFLQTQLKEITLLENTYDFLDFSLEKEQLISLLQ